MTIWRQQSRQQEHIWKFQHQKSCQARLRSCSYPLQHPVSLLLKHALEHWLEVCTCTQRHTTYSGQKTRLSKDAFRWWRTVVTSQNKQDQAMPDWKMHTCKEYGLTISKKKANGMGQDVKSLPFLAFHQFNHLGSTALRLGMPTSTNELGKLQLH